MFKKNSNWNNTNELRALLIFKELYALNFPRGMQMDLCKNMGKKTNLTCGSINYLLIIISLSISLNAKTVCDMEAVNKGNQYAMNVCASEEYKDESKLMNDIYKSLLATHKGCTVFVNNLKKSQKIWIKFRDAEVDMKLSYSDMPGNYGTMNSMLRSYELMSLTQERTKRLRQYITDGIQDEEISSDK